MEKHQDDIDLRPGQLWRLHFSVGSGNWVLQRVTEQGREQSRVSGYVNIKRDDTFILVSLNDPGPAQRAVSPRWHVVLIESQLCWFNHGWFEFSELLENTK